MFRFLPLALLLLTACGGTDPRYLIDTAPAEVAAPVRLRVATLEVRDVSLPAYAEESQILLEGGDGALTPVKGAAWADEPVRAVTLLLADTIGRAGSATVAAEPWPLPPRRRRLWRCASPKWWRALRVNLTSKANSRFRPMIMSCANGSCGLTSPSRLPTPRPQALPPPLALLCVNWPKRSRKSCLADPQSEA